MTAVEAAKLLFEDYKDCGLWCAVGSGVLQDSEVLFFYCEKETELPFEFQGYKIVVRHGGKIKPAKI